MRSTSTAILGALAMIGVTPLVAGAKTTSSWSAPDLAPATYKKVVVLAKFEDDLARRILEDAVVEGLRRREIEAVASYQVFTAEDLASDEAVAAKARDLGVDAGFVFTVMADDTQVKAGPSVHASVGVPVRAGRFGFFVGTSVPLGGGSSTVKKVTLKSEFHAAASEGPRWIASYTATLDDGSERAAREVASQALKQIKKAGVFD